LRTPNTIVAFRVQDHLGLASGSDTGAEAFVKNDCLPLREWEVLKSSRGFQLKDVGIKLAKQHHANIPAEIGHRNIQDELKHAAQIAGRKFSVHHRKQGR
jgi:hypothetical protein